MKDKLPHEILLAIARGEPLIERYWGDELDEDGCVIGRVLKEREVFPDQRTRIEAAKAAAPYFAKRLADQGGSDGAQSIADTLKELAKRLPV